MYVTENLFLLLCVIAYGLFIYGLVSRSKSKERSTTIIVFMLALLFMFTTAALCTEVENQAIGLLNLALGIVSGVMAAITMYEEGATSAGV